MNAIFCLADTRQELIRALFEQAADGIIIADRQLQPVDVNPSLCLMLGYTRPEILALPLADLIRARDLGDAWPGLDELPAGQRLVLECCLCCKDGRLLPIEAALQVLSNGRLLCIARDQSGRQQAEQALAHEAARRRVLVEQSRDGIVVLDQNGKVYESNQRFADMLGYSIAEVGQLHVWDWDDQWTSEELKEQLRQVSVEGDHFETRHRRKDGQVYDVEISTSGTMWAGQKLIFCVCRDISQRKRAEEALRESEAKYRALFEAIPDPVYLIDQETGRILDVNTAAMCIYGYSREEFTRLTNTEVSAEPDQTARATCDVLPYIPIRYHHDKDGAVFPVEITANTFDFQGRTFILAVSRNISDRQQAETERERLIAELESALVQVKRLSGLLPICASCKRIRDDHGYWQQIEAYLHDHSEAEFSHSICPECKEKLYPRDKYPYLYQEE